LENYYEIGNRKCISLGHQATAEFTTRHFERVVNLLLQVFDNLEIVSLNIRNDTYNAIFDGVEMVELMLDHLSVIEENRYSEELIKSLKDALSPASAVNLLTFLKQLSDFQSLLVGLKVGFNFFKNNDISLHTEDSIVSFGLSEGGYIELYKREDTEAVDIIIKEFNDCFVIQQSNVDGFLAEIQKQLELGSIARVKDLLHQMMEQYPATKKRGFLQLANLHFDEKEYRAATDAYMKTILMGTRKDDVIKKVQVACNVLIREAETVKEAGRWRKLLINFF
jgi:hypothetical protein